MKLVLHSTEMENFVILHCKGRLQFCEEAAVFSKVVHRIVDEGLNLVLDFQELEMIDSTGIGELVLLSMRARAVGREVSIAFPQNRVLDLLELTNVSSLFRICWSLDEASAVSEEVA